MHSGSTTLGRGLSVLAGIIILAVLAFIILAVKMGTVGPNDRASVLVAALGLLGIIFTGCVTGLGALLKDSLDRRAEILQREAEARLKASARDAEARLRAETSLKAIELMTAKDLEPPVAAERREGAIIALSSLGYHRLILRLCARFWKDNTLSSDLVMSVVDECLLSEDHKLQSAAVCLLQEDPERLPHNSRDFDFPSSFYTAWKDGLHSDVKHNLLEALAKGMLSKPYSFWENHIANQFAYTLFKMMTVDTDERFRTTAALFAMRLCHFMHENGFGGSFLPPDRKAISYTEIRDTSFLILGLQLTSSYPTEPYLRLVLDSRVSVTDYDLSRRIAEWNCSLPEPA